MEILYTEERVSTSHLAKRVLDDILHVNSPVRLTHQKRKETYKKGAGYRHFSKSLESTSEESLHSLVGKDSQLPPLAEELNLIHPEREQGRHRVTFHQNASNHKGGGAKSLVVTSVDITTETDDIQKNFLLNTPSLKEIVANVFSLHGSVQSTVDSMKEGEGKGDLKATLGRLEASNKEYVKLFEQLLSVLLSLQRQKYSKKSTSQQGEESTQGMKQELTLMKTKFVTAKETIEAEKHKSQKLTQENIDLSSQVRSLEAEIAVLRENVEFLETIKTAYNKSVEESKNFATENERRRQELIASVRKEERSIASKALHDLKQKLLRDSRAKLEKELKVLQDEIDMLKSRKGDYKNGRGDSLDETEDVVADFKRPKVSASTQTQVDEYGIWDKSDGWILPISGTVVARQQWRRAIKFAKCPNCKGIGSFIGQVAKLLILQQRGQSVVANQVADLEKRQSKWQVPDELVRFMSNLPRSVQATQPHSLAWVLRRICVLLHQKDMADMADENLGYEVQSCPEFLIESYLLRCKTRNEAELAMYELVTTMKETHRRHPLIQNFARFIGLLDSFNEEELKIAAAKKKKKEEAKAKKMQKKLASMNPRERTKYIFEQKEKEREKEESERLKKLADTMVEITDCALGSSMMSVYLYTRSRLLRESYTGIYQEYLIKLKRECTLLQATEQKLQRESDWQVSIPAHVVVESGSLYFWIPLDRALRVMSKILSFMDEDEFARVLRTLEGQIMFLTDSGILHPPEAKHTVIRQLVRRILFTKTDDMSDMSWMQIIEYHEMMGKPFSDTDIALIMETLKSSSSSNMSTTSSFNSIGEEGEGDEDENDDDNLSRKQELEQQQQQQQREQSKDEEVAMVNLDFALQILCESLQVRLKFVEKYLQGIFVEGDENGDGVLSFKEFTAIVKKVAPHFNERRVLKMFREALMTGSDNESIGPLAFVNVCKKHGLIQLVDLHGLRKQDRERDNIADTSESSHAQLIRNRAEAAELAAKATAVMQNRRRASFLNTNNNIGSLKKASTLASLSPITTNATKQKSLASVAKGVAMLQKFHSLSNFDASRQSATTKQPNETMSPSILSSPLQVLPTPASNLNLISTSLSSNKESLHLTQESATLSSSPSTTIPMEMLPNSHAGSNVTMETRITNSIVSLKCGNEAIEENTSSLLNNIHDTSIDGMNNLEGGLIRQQTSQLSLPEAQNSQQGSSVLGPVITFKSPEAAHHGAKHMKPNEELSSQKKETVIMQLKVRREARTQKY